MLFATPMYFVNHACLFPPPTKELIPKGTKTKFHGRDVVIVPDADIKRDEVVLVPAYGRSELLFVCLRNIRIADPTIPVHVFADKGGCDDDIAICKKFNARLHALKPHDYFGMIYPVMEAMNFAARGTYKRAYLIEDGVSIDRDFFDWHRSSQRDEFALCGYKFAKTPFSFDRNVPMQWFSHYGASFPRKSIELIAKHATKEFYENQYGYMREKFPVTRFGHHDSIFLRVMEQANGVCTWSTHPRCRHFGSTYSLSTLNGETLQQRIAIAESSADTYFDRPSNFVPRKLADVCVLVKTFLRDGCLYKTVAQLEEHFPECKIIVVDDGYQNEEKTKLYDRLLSLGHSVVIMPFDSGFGNKANAAIPHMDRKYVLIASDDFDCTQIRHGVEKMARVLDGLRDVAVASGRVDDNPYEGWLTYGEDFIMETFLDARDPYCSVNGVAFKYCDLTVNFSLIKTQILGVDKVRWDGQYKIGREHHDFFQDVRRMGWKSAWIPGVSVTQHVYDPANEDPTYGSYRGRARHPDRAKRFALKHKIKRYTGFDGHSELFEDFGQKKKRPRVLIAITGCHARYDYITRLRKTWAHDLPVDIRFFFGEGSHGELLSDEVQLDVKDDYHSLPAKAQAAFKWAYEKGYDYVFKSDDDCFIRIDKLLASGFAEFDYSGRRNETNHLIWCSGGPGYWLSFKAMRIVVNAPLTGDWAEDRMIGSILKDHQILPHDDHRYTLLPMETDMADNFGHWITACHVSGDIDENFRLCQHLLDREATELIF